MSFVYKGLEAQLNVPPVTEMVLERQMQRLLQQNPRITPITDRPAQPGDEVLLDYAGFCDGEQFQGGTAKGQTLVLGSGMFIPGFEEQLVGCNPGDDVVVDVTFPEVYHSKELAGRKAEFRCHVHEIRTKSAYEMDDTFAKEVGRCETLEEMRRDIKAQMERYAAEKCEMELQDQLLRRAAATLDYTVNEAELEAAVEQQIESLKTQLAQQGLTLPLYCQFMGTTEEQFYQDARPAAEAALRNHAAIARIVLLEGIEAEQAEIDEACQMVARQNGMTVEQMQPYMDEGFMTAIRQNVLTTKVMALIRQHAVITEG